ncbi:alpha/beta fold hydrolase [Caballeronia terrestris]|uniref:alpha/beta fold hydrolase n=1 Tax=Caballeronia terrestris TaxID=1226301 RepID=UPI0013595F9E|nr:alpha/beta fold hydrolase [Caballeronia terrestris]
MSDGRSDVKLSGWTTLNRWASSRKHRIPRTRGNLYAREYPGEGPTFVMMHGFPDNLQIYDFLIPHRTEAGRHVVVFDFMGFGASDKPVSEKYGFRQQVEDLLSVANALGLDRIVPVAHDSSGPAAINIALDYARRVLPFVFATRFMRKPRRSDTPSLSSCSPRKT